MGLVDCLTNARAATEQDFYVCAVFLAKHNNFTLQEASAAFEVASTVMANLKNERMALSSNVLRTKKLMADHTSEENQYEMADDLKAFKGTIHDFQPRSHKVLNAFLSTGIFQHYRMYNFLFYGERPSCVENRVLSIMVPQPIAPLDEARSRLERMQIEAEVHLRALVLPPLPATLSAEDAQTLMAKVVEEIAFGEEDGLEGESLNETRTSLKTSLTLSDAQMHEAIGEAANEIAKRLLLQVEEPVVESKKK
jgi:hypothetical protein